MPARPTARALLLTATLLTAVAASGCAGGESGDQRRSGGTAAANQPDTGLFNAGEVHTVSVSFDDAKYRAMIDTFSKSQDKEWIEAKVTIDGTTFDRAGMRLKGNSSLMPVRTANGQGGGVPFGPGGDASADRPESLPWLVKLDKYVSNQDLGGVTEFVVRSNSSKTSLNEVLALELLTQVGLASQQSTHVDLTVNDSKPVLRLVIENPNDEWDAEQFDQPGILYKSEASGNWTYRGDDPSAYKEVFDQETRTDKKDMAPLIDFLKFLNNSDDATFAAELRNRLDVESFAKYLAFEDLIGNFDDIDGPGNNSYLRFDEQTKKFTVVAWDHNLAFGGIQRMMPRGGGAAPGGSTPPNMPGGGPPAGGFPAGGPPAGGFPGGGPPGGSIPGGGFPGGGPPAGGFPGGGGMPGFGQNPLVTKFKANPEFKALYDAALAEQKQSLFKSGRASEVLTSRAELLRKKASAVVDSGTIDAEVAEIKAVIDA